jgi:hypothetical protein
VSCSSAFGSSLIFYPRREDAFIYLHKVIHWITSFAVYVAFLQLSFGSIKWNSFQLSKKARDWELWTVPNIFLHSSPFITVSSSLVCKLFIHWTAITIIVTNNNNNNNPVALVR